MKKLLWIPFLLVAAWAIYLTIRVSQEVRDVVTEPAKPDTVFVSDTLIQRVIERSTKPPTIVERIVTREVPPDTVYIAKADTAPTDLPPYAMQRVDKSGDQLSVEILSRDGKEAQRHVYTLSSDDSDYSLRSGLVPASLRERRSLRLLEFGGELRVRATSAGMDLSLAGPVNVRLPITKTTVTPVVTYDVDEGEGAIGVESRTVF